MDNLKDVKEIKFNVKTLAAMGNETIQQLAERSGIEYNHLRLVSCGKAKMTGEDLVKLSIATGIHPFQIETT